MAEEADKFSGAVTILTGANHFPIQDIESDPPTFSSEVSLRSRVVDSTPEIGLELPASGRPCPRAERGGYPRLEGKYLARS